ncbi:MULTISPECIES: ABC transporter permease [Rhizobium]|jgi:spermidine/putrescine transport system permease protein|uniref:Spermidine/putrescine transport system permease protein n=1 Tax=Rhizobium lusitanum TaxID=293958 RepID=A0A1C3WRZ1_9HYPH|nr:MULTISPECIES: ABC transporter permease [Rhizobium]NKJ04192.1 spermidine/putrescine transport system permease protein [Rhizobium sp. SG741]NRP89510.1 Inner membrane ABC transporter permease protein YdcV [Ensifer adhaerens]NTJ10366.1 ABC transporter permease [Rhizobium lusitanum]SCB42728.1 spermidine/putrescine transport system permease protein [Rhizobium lusitanum]
MIGLARFYLAAILVFLYLPIVVMMAMGFNESSLYELPFHFSTKWYVALAGNDQLISAGINSIVIAVITAVVSTILGTMASVALARRTFKGKTLLQLMLLPPIAIPWLITGTAMLVFFFWTGIGRGMHALLIGHVALAIPYVVLVVGTGFQTIRADLEEAAMSLGSTPIHAFFSVTLPLLAPSILGAALFAFAVSLDQFVISYFLATPGFTTLPVQIYSAIRKGFTPEINAISTILLIGSMAAILVFAIFARPGGVSDKR